MTADTTDDDIRRLHAQGHGRNAISRELGISRRRVSETAQQLGLTFDRASTKKATEARTADSKARRAALAAKILDLIENETEALTTLGPAGNAADAARRASAIAGISRAVADVTRTIPATDGTDDALHELGIFGEIIALAAKEASQQTTSE